MDRTRTIGIAALAAAVALGSLAPLRGQDEKDPKDAPTPPNVSPGFAGRFGERRNLVARGGGSAATESAVEAGLRWLARHQSKDGSWSATNFTGQCKGTACNGSGQTDYDVGLTGLAALAFLGTGVTPGTRIKYEDPVTGETICQGDVIRNALKFLISQQKGDGQIGPNVQELMYNHAIGSLALVEAWGITNAIAYKAPARKAVDFIVSAQNFGLGWRYSPQPGNNDTSVTGWCVQVLHAARLAKLDVPQTALDGAKNWILRVTDADGKTGYDKLGSGDVVAAGKNEAWLSHPTMTAVGLLCRLEIDQKRVASLEPSAKLVVDDLPKWDPKAQHPSNDSYYWYYGTNALFQYDGPNGPSWKNWNKAIADTLCQNQCLKKDGCADGSWPSENLDRWGYAGGRVYTTAISVLTLETYYRYPAIGAPEKK